MKFFVSFVFCITIATNSFATPKQLTGQHAPANSPALSPEEAQKKFVLHDGFEVRLFAAEPDVINPVAITWDDRGRLWVVELYEYPLGAAPGTKPRDRIKILEDTDNDGRADNVKIFADGLNLATGILYGNGGVYVGQAPELLFLEDTNDDDVADKRTTLLTGFGLHDRHELLNGFTWGPDGQLYMTHGVFTASSVKIPEATTPGVTMNAAVARFDPRSKKFEIYADGTSNPWGVDFDKYGNAFVSACVIDHLFHMAAGGIYQRQGGVPGNPYAYELLPSIVEHKHHMAAYAGICIYQGDNFPEEYRGRVFFGNIHQNAINHDRLIPNGSSFKAVAEKDFLTTSDGWFRPVSEQTGPDGALWIADWYDKYPCYQNAQADPEGVDRERGRIWRVVYTGKNVGKKMGSRPDVKMDLKKLKNEKLVNLLEHPNVWHRRMAQRLLSERSEYKTFSSNDRGGSRVSPGIGEGREQLEKLLIEGKSLEARLASLWTLHQIGGMWPGGHQKYHGDPVLLDWSEALDLLVSDPVPEIRIWAINFLAEDLRVREKAVIGNITIEATGNQEFVESVRKFYKKSLSLLEQAAADPDPRVRFAVAVACRQLVSGSLTVNSPDSVAEFIAFKGRRHGADWQAGVEKAVKADWESRTALIGKILTKLIESSADAKDPLIPFMIWMASEPLVAKNPARGLQWLAENGANNMPLSGILARKAMRRICDTGEPEKMDAAVKFLKSVWGKNDELTLATLDGLIEGQKAKPLRPTIETKTLIAEANVTSTGKIKERVQQLATIWGDASALETTIETIRNAANNENRIKAIQSVRQLKSEAARDVLLELIANESNEQVTIEALQAVGAIGGDNVPSEIVKHWKKLSAKSRVAAAEMMISRPQWTRPLLDALDDKTISPQELSATVVRALLTSKNPNFVARAERLFGKFRETSADKLKLIAEKRKAVLTGEPNLKRGHELAKTSCFVCHKLHGEGAEVGPDLTGVGRSTLDALLANVIDPNQIIGKGYENVLVETKDDRSVSGRMIENSDAHVKLLAAGPKEETIAKSDIASMRVSELSVMPEGLEQMPVEDFRDMIWFILSPPQEGELTLEKRNALIGK